MSVHMAPELTRAERAEVDRFAIHDLDELDTVPCRKCESPAWWVIQMRCCPAASCLCTWHKTLHRALVEKHLSGGKAAVCSDCGHRYPGPVTYDQIIKVREL